jgi:heme/copper-type cytochrome/quinol oxidase subunit 4
MIFICKALSDTYNQSTYRAITSYGEKKVKKQSTLTIAFLASLVLLVFPLTTAAESAVRPTVTLPNNNWILRSESTYPTEPSEHDSRGAGSIEYRNEVNYDFVMIYYERAVYGPMSDDSLTADAIHIFARDHEDTVMSESGITTFANVHTGYAKGIESEYDIYTLELAFVKGADYFNVFAYYDANAQSESQVNALINSIEVSGTSSTPSQSLTPSPTPSPTPSLSPSPPVSPTPSSESTTEAQTGVESYYIYIVVTGIAIVVVIVVLLVVLRKRKSQNKQSSEPMLTSQPPPPPPPPV